MTESIKVEAHELEVMVRRVLAERAGHRAIADASKGADLWRLMAELGWLSLTAPQAMGGLEQSFDVLAVIYKEMGRSLAREPILGSLIAGEALATSQSSAAGEMLRAICEGRIRVGLPIAPFESALQADRAGDALTLRGMVRTVLHADSATHVLIRVILENGDGWLLAPLAAEGISQKDLPTWDRTRQVSDVSFSGVHASSSCLVAEGATVAALDQQLSTHFHLAVACDCIGGARVLFENTVAYMRSRQQFGRPIGSFQALKHRCATLHTWIEAGETLIDEAVAERRTGTGDSLAAACKLYASAVYRDVAIEAVQLHGGIGFTWEHDCHLFLKRALLNEQFARPPRAERDLIAETLLGVRRPAIGGEPCW